MASWCFYRQPRFVSGRQKENPESSSNSEEDNKESTEANYDEDEDQLEEEEEQEEDETGEISAITTNQVFWIL